MENNYFVGSICLSDIPKDQIKKAENGKLYLALTISQRKTPQKFQTKNGERTLTHYVSCAPKQEERKEGVNYFIGDLEMRTPRPPQPVTFEQINEAPVAADIDQLPF